MLEVTDKPLVAYVFPEEQARSPCFLVWVNDTPIAALQAEKADFAAVESTGPVTVRVEVAEAVVNAVVRPLSRGIVAKITGNSLTFSMPGPGQVCVDVEGLKPLFIYVNAPDPRKPEPTDPGVIFFAAGQIHEAGEIELKSGETLYIEGGAVVRGNVHAAHADFVSIRGHGILDGSCYSYAAGERVRSIIFEHCRHVTVEGIVMIEPSSWMLVLGRCRDVTVRDLKQIGSCMSSDGIDICGSSDVLIEGCCLRNDDDNVVIKSLHVPQHLSWEGDVEHIRVRNCVILNGQPGNAMEIGYELRAGYVRDVVFEDIDVIYSHGEGAVFSIHNGDRAIVQDVRWENIRIEHYWDKLIDFRVVHARYNTDPKRGAIRRIHLKNIQIIRSPFNPGCTISLIGGYEAGAPIEDIVFEDVFINGEKITHIDDLEMHTRHARDIQVR